jgi:hypothetical protein
MMVVDASPVAGSIGITAGGQPLVQFTMLFGAVFLRGEFSGSICGAAGTSGTFTVATSQILVMVLHVLPAQHS